MAQIQRTVVTVCSVFFFLVITDKSLFAIDSELTRQTLLNVKGVSLVVEDLRPSIQKHAERFWLTKDQLQKDIEERLIRSGLMVLRQEQWLKSPGKPIHHINTHESEKYWYAYTSIDYRQLVSRDANTGMKTPASTWSVDMAGVANNGNLNIVRNSVRVLMNRFIEACQPTI